MLILVLGILGNLVVEIIYKFYPPDYPRGLTVSGEGWIFAKPDIALATIGVKTEGWRVKK